MASALELQGLVEKRIAEIRFELSSYRDDGEGYLLRHGVAVIDPAEISRVKQMIADFELWIEVRLLVAAAGPPSPRLQ